MSERRRAFHTLDGLRGIAALLVVSRHVGPLSEVISLPETFLAVDLFFLLSGFVIAYAYDDRLAQPGFVGMFLGIRLIRLYPLYILGLLVGAIYRVLSLLNGSEGWTSVYLLKALLLGILLIPATPLTTIGSSALDTPTWTLLPELVANLVYARCFRWMNRGVLACIVAIGGASVIACRLHYGTLDAGWEFEQWPIIAARLTFSFFGGVLLFRLAGDRRQTRSWVAWLSILTIGAVLSVTPPPNLDAAYEIVTVLIVFPLVVWVSCRNEPAGTSRSLFRFLGVISYAVYVLHQPVGVLFTKVAEKAGHLNLQHFAIPALLVFGVCIIIAAWLADEYYDIPVRRWLTRQLYKTYAGDQQDRLTGKIPAADVSNMAATRSETHKH